MAKSTDEETVATAKIVSYISQEEAAYHPTKRATQGSTSVGHEEEGANGKLGQEPLLWFPQVGMGKWGLSTVPSHLVPALG